MWCAQCLLLVLALKCVPLPLLPKLSAASKAQAALCIIIVSIIGVRFRLGTGISEL